MEKCYLKWSNLAFFSSLSQTVKILKLLKHILIHSWFGLFVGLVGFFQIQDDYSKFLKSC